MKGIDVSRWQGSIDWNEVKKHIDFAIIRMGFGTTVDGNALFNLAECKRLKIPYAVYLFSYPRKTIDAVTEAQFCCNWLRLNKFNPFCVFYDFEYDSIKNWEKANKNSVFDKSTMWRYADEFCTTVESNGFTSGIYTNLDFYGKMKNALTTNRLLWIAKYSKAKPDMKFHIWQQSSTGKIPGINGNVDINYAERGSFEMQEYYKTIDDVPQAYKHYVERWIKYGIVAGKENDLHLSEDMIRTLIFVERMIANEV